MGRDALQFEWAVLTNKDAHKPGTQKHADAIGQGLDDRRNVGIAVQRMSYLRQNFRAAMVFARSFGKPTRLDQAAKLAGEDGRFRGEVIVEKAGVGVVQK